MSIGATCKFLEFSRVTGLSLHVSVVSVTFRSCDRLSAFMTVKECWETVHYLTVLKTYWYLQNQHVHGFGLMIIKDGGGMYPTTLSSNPHHQVLNFSSYFIHLIHSSLS